MYSIVRNARGVELVKKTALGLSLLFYLLFSAASVLVLVNSAAGIVPRSTMPAIVINSDGSITGREWNPQYREFEIPYTEFINRTGNVYTLTADIEGYAVIIERSNIVFDGAEHTIHTPPPEAGTVHSNAGLTLLEVTHVTVKNLEVSGVTLSRGIDLYYSYNCILTGVKLFNIHYANLTETVSQTRILGDFNTITESNVRLNVDGSNNLFIENNVYELDVYGSNNRFYQNNFFLTDIPGITHDNFWDNGAVGNYWSNYSIKYPNASEIGNTGIGDMTHIIERAILPGLNDPNAKNVDNYPLMYPWGAPAVALLGMQNATYSGGCFLNFNVSKSVVWLGYSIDGQDNVTVTGNVTLSELSGGLHNVTVYAEDAFGHVGVSETASFTVTEPFPVVAVTAASGVAVICVGLLVYFKKRKN
jgi:hypothetical protein